MKEGMRIVAIALVLAATSIACGGTDEQADTSPTAAGETPAAGQTARPDAEPQKKLAFVDSALGKILTVEGGNTLYVFTRDQSGQSSCVDACAQTWPPLDVGDGVGAGAGVDAEKIGSLARPGGGEQVSYDGKPLYQYSGDTKPGDTKGQGVGGNWFVVGTDGQPIKT